METHEKDMTLGTLKAWSSDRVILKRRATDIRQSEQ